MQKAAVQFIHSHAHTHTLSQRDSHTAKRKAALSSLRHSQRPQRIRIRRIRHWQRQRQRQQQSDIEVDKEMQAL